MPFFRRYSLALDVSISPTSIIRTLREDDKVLSMRGTTLPTLLIKTIQKSFSFANTLAWSSGVTKVLVDI